MVYSNKDLQSITLPIFFGLLIQQLISLTDTAFLGRIGTVELGASALGSVFYFMIFMLGQGFGIGVQILMSQAHGEHNFRQIGRLLYQGLFALLIFALSILILSYFFTPVLLRYIVTSDAVYQHTLQYLDIRLFGLFFSFPIVIFRSFFVGITRTKSLTFSSIIMFSVNFILDYLFVFGKFGCPKLGLVGTAWAAIIAEAVAALYFLVYLLLTIEHKKYALANIVFFNKKILHSILKLSVWTILQYLVSWLSWFLFLLANEHISEDYLAVSDILNNISHIPFLLLASFSATTATAVGNLIGLEKTEEIIPTANRLIKLSYIYGFILISAMMLFPDFILNIFTDDTHLIQTAFAPYYSSLTIYYTLVPGMIYLNTILGAGRAKDAMIVDSVSAIFYTCSVWVLVILLRSELYICWLGEHFYNLMLIIMTYKYLFSQKHRCFKITKD